MLLKAGVDISRLERNTRRGLQIVDDNFADQNMEVIVTSTYEGNHKAGSLHYANRAFDIGLPNSGRSEFAKEIPEDLGDDFDFVVEFDHYHIEYDPKGER